MSTIVTRAGKGSALTHNEVDANFNNLNNDKIEAAQSVTLTNKTLSTGTAITAGTINNATIGASTPSTGAFTTLSATGVTTVQAGTVSAPAITTSGDTNTGIFFPAADTIAFTEGGVESMRIDSAGNVGIGATSVLSTVGRVVQILNSGSSAATLQLQDSTTGSTASDGLQLQVNGATSYLWSYENGALIFGTNNGERMRITSDGNLGLGVTPSAWALSGSTAFQIRNAAVAGFQNRVYLLANAYFNASGNGVYIANDYATQYGQSAGQHIWFTAPSGTAGNTITFTQAMTLDASGNLGIGNTTPHAQLNTYTLQGGSTIAVTHGTGGTYPKVSGISFGSTSTSISPSNNGGTTTFVGGAGIYANNTAASNNPTDLVFWTTAGGSPAERMRIDSSGFTQFSSNLVMPYQGAPTSKSGAATLTGAELVTGILNTTGTTYTITLPTGTNIEGALTWSANNVCLDWYVINTASGTITIGANGNTTLGSLTIATGTSAQFRIRRTAANTFTVYRL